MQRSQPGSPTVKSISLPAIVDKEHRSVLIPKGATTPQGKQFIRDTQSESTISIVPGASKDEVDSFLEETVSA